MPNADATLATDRRYYALILHGESERAVDLAPLAVARQLADRHGGQAHAVLYGQTPQAGLARARALGLDHAWTLPGTDADPQPHQLVDHYAAALGTPMLADGLGHALLLVAARPDDEEFAGRLAARLHAAPLGRCEEFDVDPSGALTARRSAYGGRLDVELRCEAGPAIASVREAPAPAAGAPAGQCAALQEHMLDGSGPIADPYPLTALPRAEPHASLDGARLVVAGGRGIGGEDGFAKLYALADQLGGAVGASLPAVDAGWAPVARQVGQSGRYVGPQLYLAIGISGTPQHLAGIDPHTRIVAVNRDAQAPIFGIAHLGVVAEWQALLPELMTALDETAQD